MHLSKIFFFFLQVNFLHLIQNSEGCPVAVAAAEEIVYLLKPDVPEKILHSTYGHTVTSLDVSLDKAAFGVKSYGWFSNNGNKVKRLLRQPLIAVEPHFS